MPDVLDAATDTSDGPDETRPTQPAPQQFADALLGRLNDPTIDSDVLVEVIKGAAATPPGDEAFDSVAATIRGYIGYDAGTYVLDWLTSNTPENLESELDDLDLEDEDRNRLRRLLRRIRGVHGPAIAPLFAMWQERPDDWRRASRYIYWDKVAEKWIIKVVIDKYNGESVAWEGPATSVANIVRFLVATLNILNERESIEPNTLDLLGDELNTFRSTYYEDAGQSASPEPAPSATVATA